MNQSRRNLITTGLAAAAGATGLAAAGKLADKYGLLAPAVSTAPARPSPTRPRSSSPAIPWRGNFAATRSRRSPL